jgi:hypothetical protein
MRVATLPGVIEKGQYEYPISFFVPTGSPATMVVGGGRDKGRVVYNLYVWLDRPGMMKWDVKNEIQLTVKVPAPTQQRIPHWIEPANVDIKSCFCFSRGNILAGAVVESAVASKGSTMWVNYALENQSSSAVKAIEINLNQHTRVKANHRGGANHGIPTHMHGTSNFIVFTARMTPEEAGLDLKALNSSQKEEASTEQWSALGRLRETLQAGKLQKKFDILASATESYQGSIIQVTHTLSVKICTPFGTASPTITCPIRICSETGNWMPVAGAELFAPPEPSAPLALPAGWAPVVAKTVVYPAIPLGDFGDAEEPDGTPVVYSGMHGAVEKSVGVGALMQTLSTSCFDPCGEVEQWLRNGNSMKDFSVDNIHDLFAAVGNSFDKTRMAGIVAAARQGAFTCAHIAAACRGSPDFIRREVAESLLSHTGTVVDKENSKLIGEQLTSFQFMTLERFFR